MARDRKRAKQRRERRGPARRRAEGTSTLPPSQPTRADLPGSLDHASGEVDEFDAALLRGAGSLAPAPEATDAEPLSEPAPDATDAELLAAEPLSEPAPEPSALGAPDVADEPDRPDELDTGLDTEAPDALSADGSGGGAGAGIGGAGGIGDGGAGAAAERAPGAPLQGGNRAVAFLRASWAELQRVQWPDRRQVTQATAVVIGFVAVAGAYLGVADYIAKEIVEFIL